VQTQWRVGFGGATGLDYPGCEAAARMAGIEVTADLFDGLRVCEAAAMQAMSERQERERQRAQWHN